MSIGRNIVGRAARRLGLLPRPMPADFIFDSAHAEETRRRDELAEYDEHLAVYGRHFATVPRNARPFSVLDVGCGTGRYFRFFADADLVVGLDPSTEMLKQAQRAVGVETLGRPPVLVIGKTDDIPLLPGTFDLVYCIGVLGQLVPISKAQLGYLLKFCRKGGTAILSILADRTDTKGPARHLFCPATDAQIRAAIADVQAVNCKLSEATFKLPSIGVKETFHIISLIH
jgi:ubiquinone/menaquinone biosynthesis C-methylase UbiE